MSRDDPQMKIRLPADLKQKVESSAEAASRTLNAEIVARLTDSFDDLHRKEVAGLRDQLQSLDKQIWLNDSKFSELRMRELMSRLLAARLAAIADPTALKENAELRAAVQEFKGQEQNLMLELLEVMISGMGQISSSLKQGIDKGHLTIVPDDQPTKFAGASKKLAKANKGVLGMLESMPSDVVMEFFERPAVKQALIDMQSTVEWSQDRQEKPTQK
ncbi:MAG: Arc family DNA-binding protein [Xylophilus ampelinus]